MSTPNKYYQAKTLNKGASKYTENASGGPDSSAGEDYTPYPETRNKMGTGEYNVNAIGGGYRGRGVDDSIPSMKPNRDPKGPGSGNDGNPSY